MPKGGIETTIGHWSKLLGGLTTTPQDFYAAVEAAVQRRQIPDCKISRTEWSEQGSRRPNASTFKSKGKNF